MRHLRLGALLLLAVLLLGQQPVWADSTSQCGAAGIANCATLTLNQTSGICTLYNQGTLSEHMDCTAATYVGTVSTYGWINAGTVYLEVDGIAPSCTSYSDGRSWGVPATPTTVSISVTCDAFTLHYNECIGWPGALARATFDATLPPPTLQRRVYAAGSYMCIPA
jgi:hypothetical protein